ncbi:MAG TPA: YqaA family protein [Stellaceae bacterium]|nr:YqaA family protein [Stellaceae bacterium]
MIYRLYSRTLAVAAHRHAMAALALIAFAESSFLPLPPDILLVPMTLAQPRRAWLIAAVCTIASVTGGYVGYAIGYFLFDTIGLRVLEFYHMMDKYEAFKAAFAEWGAWIIIIKGLTPIPYKLVTIASGAAQFDLVTFTLASLVSRSLRFFLLAALLWRFGEPIRDFIERRLMLVTSLAAAALVGGFVVLRYL